jgi:hypothetical protein
MTSTVGKLRTGALDLVLSSGELSDQVFLWTKRANGNGAEWLLNQGSRPARWWK